MEWLPFDPSRAHGADRPEEPPARRERARYARVTEARPLSVSELAAIIRATLEERVPSPIRVVGEVSNFSDRSHWFFSLKDEHAVLSCVCWASTARKLSFTPADGQEVVVSGAVSHWEPAGRTQLYVNAIEPVGMGALDARFRALCSELRALGWFDDARKRRLPAFPKRIAVITSRTGAAVRDVLETAAQRCRAVGFVIVDVRVQGDGAAEEIARAIRWVDQRHEQLGVDAIIVTRGGGSIEDLQPFNERVVAQAAIDCTLPLVAAIGHESDTTIIELVADVRASTPTQAAMRLVPDGAALAQELDHHSRRLDLLARRRLDRAFHRSESLAAALRRVVQLRAGEARSRLERLASALVGLQPHALLAARRERIAAYAGRLDRAARARVARRADIAALGHRLRVAARSRVEIVRGRISSLEREINAVDPRRVLERGFSYTTVQGTLVRSVRDVRAGDHLRTHVADGEIDSTVAGSPPKRTGRTGRAPRDGENLFEGPEP